MAVSINGYAARKDHVDGTHEIVFFRFTRKGVQRFITRDIPYWSRGPYPVAVYSVVAISYRDFRLHKGRHDCRASDCPDTAEAAAARASRVQRPQWVVS
jgi:hypothetical protein